MGTTSLPGAQGAHVDPTVVATIPTGSGARGVGVNASTGLVYVANLGGGTVSVVDATTDTLVTNIPSGGVPVGVDVDPTPNRIYVADFSGDSVFVIDGGSNTVLSTIPVGDGTFDVGVNPGADRVYAANFLSDNVSVINAISGAVVATIPVGLGPSDVAANASTGRVYVANNSSDTVSVIDGLSNTVIATMPVGTGPAGVAVNPGVGRVYVSNFTSDNVSVIDAVANSVIATVPVGNGPVGVAVNASTGFVYVENNSSSSVSIIDGGTDIVVAEVPLAPSTWAVDVGVNPDTDRVYVANIGTGVLSVIGSISTDSDGDGIKDGVDGLFVNASFVDQSAVFSNNFTDQHLGGTSFGSIVSIDDLLVSVEDATNPDGLLLEAAGGGSGTAAFDACNLPVLLTDGDSVVVTCGSLTVEVLVGPVEVPVSDQVSVTVPSGGTAKVTETEDGQFIIENIGETAIVVEIGDIAVQLEPGEEIEASPRELKARVQSLIEPYEAESKSIEKAINRLQKAREPELWIDGFHPDPDRGDKVFKEEAKAIKELLKAIKKAGQDEEETLSAEGLAAAQEAIDLLVDIDELLALIAIEDAEAAGALSPKIRNKVEKEIAKAEEARGAGKPKKQLCLKSRGMTHSCRSYASPGRAMFEHGVEDDEQFAHTRDEGHLLRFASRQQPLVEVADDGVVAGCGQRPHVKGAPHSGAPAPDSAFASQDATVPVEGSHAHQGGDLPAVQGAQLRQVGHQSEGELLSHAGNGAQEIIPLPPHGTLAESLAQPLVQVVQLLLQPGDMSLNAGADGADGGTQPVLLRDQHGHHLVSAGSQGVENLGLGVPQRAHGGTNDIGEVGQDRRVQSVGLGQRLGGPGEVSNLTGVDDDYGQRRSCQGCHQGQFQTTRSLQQD